ncbi:MAG: hypothetical protein ACRD32_07510 [Nitrososphaerales archaeon]
MVILLPSILINMDDGEVEVPKSVRPIMMETAEETKLGERRGAKKQYRYGNLHIREYDDKYVVHMDKVDPRKDPLGHLLKDSPETLLGIASSIYFGKKVGSKVFNERKERSKNALLESVFMGALASVTAGYVGYKFGKHLKREK